MLSETPPLTLLVVRMVHTWEVGGQVRLGELKALTDALHAHVEAALREVQPTLCVPPALRDALVGWLQAPTRDEDGQRQAAQALMAVCQQLDIQPTARPRCTTRGHVWSALDPGPLDPCQCGAVQWGQPSGVRCTGHEHLWLQPCPEPSARCQCGAVPFKDAEPV